MYTRHAQYTYCVLRMRSTMYDVSTGIVHNNVKTSADAEEIYKLLPTSLQRSVDLAKEKGASTWLTALPLVEHGFTLHKGAFHDAALALRYG